MPIQLSGSLVITGSITTTGVITMSGSIASATSASYSSTSDLLQGTGSVGFATTASLLTVSSSQQQISASQQQISSSLLRISSSYASTGSNTFTGIQNFSNTCTPNSFTAGASIYTAGGLQVTQDTYFSSSVYIKGNVTVYGTQSVSYVSSSQFNIGTNIITVNTFTPSVRYGGLSVFDSGSTGLTGSIFWDSELNRWIYVNASGSGGGATYGGGMFISGPRNSQGIGCEQGTTACMLLVGQGGDHLTSSLIYHDSSVTCIPGTLNVFGNISSSGNLRIDKDQPDIQLNITCTTQYARLYFNEIGSGISGLQQIGSTFTGDRKNRLELFGSAVSFVQGDFNNPAVFITGSNVGIRTITPTYTLDVNGTGGFCGNVIISRNLNSLSRLTVSNTTAGANAYVETTLTADSSAGSGAVGKFGSSTTPYKITTASNTFLYNGPVAGDISILNDFASGAIKMAAGGSSTSHFTIASTGAATFSNNVLIEANQTSSPLFYAKQTGASGYTAIQFSGNNGTDIGALTTYNGQIYFGSWNGGNGSFGQLQINKTTGVATFTCQVNAESFYTNDTRYVSNQIMAGYNTNSEDSDIWINYTGYQGGTTRFRDFRVGNGKQGQIAVFDGSTSATTFSGTVNVYDGSSHGLSISNSSGAITFTNNWSKTTFTVGSAQDIEFNDDAGVKRLFLSTGGSVGIGTVSPSAKLDIAQMGGDNTRTCHALYLRAGNNSDVFNSNQILFSYNCGTQYAHAIKTRHNSNNAIDNAIDFYTWKYGDAADTKAGLYVMTIAGNGRIGIGTCQPQSTIDLSSGDTTRIVQFYGGSDTDRYGIGKFAGSGATTVFHGGAGASNRVSLGCYNGTTYVPNFEVLGNGVICMINIGSGAGTYALKWNSSTKNVTYDTSSERYKDNIRNSTYGLCHILQLNSRMFEYKDQCRTDIGFIAEELYPIIPELVMLDENLLPNGVSYDRMVSVLVEGMKQQQCTINTLKTCLGIN